jgi:hypothetical protein
MGCCVDEAGGVTPKRPRRFGLLAPFCLQSFAGRTHANTPEGRHSGRAPFLVHSSFTPPASGPDVSVPLQHPNQTCPTAPARGLGQRQPKQQNLGSHRGSLFWCFGGEESAAHDGLRRPIKPALPSRSVLQPIHVGTPLWPTAGVWQDIAKGGLGR